MKEATAKLLDDGVKLFAEAFDKLLAAVEYRCKCKASITRDRQSATLSKPVETDVQKSLEDWKATGKVRRLWAGDASLWTGKDEGGWLGWLGMTDDQLANVQHLDHIAAEVKSEGFSQALLLGMGGSSLCPEVMKMTFGKMPGYPELHVLDSTDPAQVKPFEQKVDLRKALFIVSSKSGSTLEPNIFKQYFFNRVAQAIGAEEAGRRFIAIPDPGSEMAKTGDAGGVRASCFGRASIGGRYSALSDFGMVPSAVMGIDVARFLGQADQMAKACASSVPV